MTMPCWTAFSTVLLVGLHHTFSQISNCESIPGGENLTKTLVEEKDADHHDNGSTTPWSACDYPNPQYQWRQCGRPHGSSLCDPDELLTENEAEEIERLLAEAYNETVCRCEADCDADYSGSIIAVALLGRLRLPDMLGVYCKDWRCGEVYPALDTEIRRPTDLELRQGLLDFTHHLAKRTWRFGKCDDHVIIVYNQEFQQLAISPGETIEGLVGKKRLQQLQENSLKYLKKGRIKEGIKTIVEQCVRVLKHRPAWPLVVGILCALLTFILVLIGIATTALYCRSELEQGRTAKEVLFSTVSGWWTFLFAGNPPLHDECTETIPVVFTSGRGGVTFNRATVL